MVASMRNGVLAVTRDGAIAVMNPEAYRIFGLVPNPADIGRAYADVLRMHPDMVRVMVSAFELSHLPNRVELRLKSTGRVNRLHALADSRRGGRDRRGGALLQGPDASRAARGARAAPGFDSRRSARWPRPWRTS